MSDSAIVRVNCKPGRSEKKSARYWTLYRRIIKRNKKEEKIFCHLQITWPENEQWAVSFVNTTQGMTEWMKKHAKGCLMFDVEWTPATGKVGLVQFATPLPNRQILVVDCARGGMGGIQNLFLQRIAENKMVGWATNNDLIKLGLDSLSTNSNIVDLQKLAKQPFPHNMQNQHQNNISSNPPLDRHGKPHNSDWSLDHMAYTFLGFHIKVPLKKDKETGEEVYPKYGDPTWQLYDRDIHYAANDVIAVAYIYEKLKYIYEPSAMEKKEEKGEEKPTEEKPTFTQWVEKKENM